MSVVAFGYVIVPSRDANRDSHDSVDPLLYMYMENMSKRRLPFVWHALRAAAILHKRCRAFCLAE